MFQRQAKGAFKTTGSEQWPWLCASGFPLCCLLPAKDAVGEGGAAAPDDKLQDSFPINEPEGPRVLGGTGPPRFCRQLGGGKPYHDRGGLCSPGRWPHHARSYADGSSWDWLRDLLRAMLEAAGLEWSG